MEYWTDEQRSPEQTRAAQWDSELCPAPRLQRFCSLADMFPTRKYSTHGATVTPSEVNYDSPVLGKLHPSTAINRRNMVRPLRKRRASMLIVESVAARNCSRVLRVPFSGGLLAKYFILGRTLSFLVRDGATSVRAATTVD